MVETGTQKVLVVGLDGATFDVLTPMMHRGLLPHLAKLIGEGVSGPLRSVVPPVSGPAWVSFMTGKDPGRHGIYDFYKFAPGRKGKRIISFRDIHARSLWEVLTTHGKKVGAINVPITFPPYPVDGFMLTGMLTPPDAEARQAHPPELYKELTARFGTFSTDVWWTNYRANEKPQFFAGHDRLHGSASGDLPVSHAGKTPGVSSLTTITETDRLQHAFACSCSTIPKRTAGRMPRKCGGCSTNFSSVWINIWVPCAKAAGPETSLFIVSDHGFGPTTDFPDQPVAGSRRIPDGEGRRLSVESHSGPDPQPSGRTEGGAGLGANRCTQIGCGGRRPRVGGCNAESETHLIECVDWDRTVAFMDLDDRQGIYINLRGREPRGRPSSTSRVRIASSPLRKVVHPRTRQPLLTYAKRREEVYDGPFVEAAPDIILCFNDFETYGVGVLGFGVFRRGLWAKPKWPWFSAHHRMDGVLVAHGTNIRHRRMTDAS
ncbi:MAG: alkaline phosphatase family protein [Nitrospiraceae bacterium]